MAHKVCAKLMESWAKSPFLNGADVLVVGECVQNSYPEIYARMSDGKVVLTACPEAEQPIAVVIPNPPKIVREETPVYLIKPPQPAPTPKKKRKPKARPENQAELFDNQADFSGSKTDFGLYKCQACGALVLGFAREEHTEEHHKGENPGYEKLR